MYIVYGLKTPVMQGGGLASLRFNRFPLCSAFFCFVFSGRMNLILNRLCVCKNVSYLTYINIRGGVNGGYFLLILHTICIGGLINVK